jgi:hypothetical protein
MAYSCEDFENIAQVDIWPSEDLANTKHLPTSEHKLQPNDLVVDKQ